MATMATMTAVPETVNCGFGETESSCFWTWTKGMKYANGSIYKGHLDRFGKRTGAGTLRSPICVYGVYEPTNTSALLNWMEYYGEWQNDKPSGWGIAKRYRGDGTTTTIYDGEWANGVPISEP